MTIDLDKINALRLQHLAPVPVKACAMFWIGNQLAAYAFMKMGCLVFGQAASRRHTAPVSGQGVPDAYPGYIRMLSDLMDHLPETIRKFIRIRSEIADHLILRREPTVINQHPPDGQLFIRKLFCLFFKSLRCHIRVKGIPAAPAQVTEHIRNSPFFPWQDMFLPDQPGKSLMYSYIHSISFSIDKEWLTYLLKSPDASIHYKAQLRLCPTGQGRFKLFSHCRDQAAETIFKLKKGYLGLLRDILKGTDKYRPGPPGAEHVQGRDLLRPSVHGNKDPDRRITGKPHRRSQRIRIHDRRKDTADTASILQRLIYSYADYFIFRSCCIHIHSKLHRFFVLKTHLYPALILDHYTLPFAKKILLYI